MPWCRLFLSSAVILGSAAAAQAEVSFIGGTTPSERPANAPVITEFSKDGDWYARALIGIEPPYPASLRFLEDQGAWHTPFNHPNMPAPYDLRGLYEQ